MSAPDLLTEITLAFQDEPHPGEMNIVYDNFNPDPEVIQLRENLKPHTWQTIPDDILQDVQSGPIFLSKQGLRYYLPAYMSYSIREYREADSIPDDLVFIMKLPTGVDIMLLAIQEKLSPSLAYSYPVTTSSDYFQRRFRDLNGSVHSFINRWHQFSPAQGRAILHFLEWLRDEHSDDYFDNELDIAIERYWFQFA